MTSLTQFTLLASGLFTKGVVFKIPKIFPGIWREISGLVLAGILGRHGAGGPIGGNVSENYFLGRFAGRGKGTRTGPASFAQGGPVVNLCGTLNNQAVFAMTSANPKVGLSHDNKPPPHNGVATRMRGAWHGKPMAWQGRRPYVTTPVKWGLKGGQV